MDFAKGRSAKGDDAREGVGPRAQPGFFELGTDGPTVVLVGIDESATSWRAAAYAVGLARRQGARLVTVHVRPPMGLGAASAAGTVALEEAAHEIADSVRATVESSLAPLLTTPLTHLERSGDPYGELVKVAEEVCAEAVIVGASTKAGHRLIGSLAVRLVRAGRWPVTVVP
jgi:nucleotide-binding universal stress UspA family protein